MESLVTFSFCDVLGAFICHHSACQTVIRNSNIEKHLRRKHKVPALAARLQSAKITGPFAGRSPQPIASRYYQDPFPRPGEQPLLAIHGLPLYDIKKCPLCIYYGKVSNSLKKHIRATHCSHECLEAVLATADRSQLLKGQTLCTGPQKRYFPVSISVSLNCVTPTASQPQPSILFDQHSDQEHVPSSDRISIKERSANLSMKVLGISEFLDTNNLTLDDAYALSAIEDRRTRSNLVKLLTIYIQYFAELSPPVPLSIVEAVKIRDATTVASFSLRIKMESKQRYARVLARFISLVARLGSSCHLNFSMNHVLATCAQDLMSLVSSAEGITREQIDSVHSLCRTLLLGGVCASKGETVLLEALFKIVLAGYTCGFRSKRVRVGDSEDASHTAAALQYFCHVSALGEFFVRPVGFGEQRDGGEQQRLEWIRQMVSTEACTPASYIRTVLLKTKRISPGESPNVDFVPCKVHPFCGSVENVEVQMNSDSPGSLGFAVRKISDEIEQLIRRELMVDYNIPPNFATTILSFPDKYNERDPGYFFGSHGHASRLIRSWADDFAKHLSRCQDPIIQRDNKSNATPWRPSQHASSWLQAVDKLSATLYILVHICGGGPPRVTEMIESKLRNTAGSRRNFFIIHKCLAVIGVYSKTSDQFEKPKPIARFLDGRTTELLLLFIVYIKPTQAFLLRKSMAERDACDDYLFCQGSRKLNEKAIYREFANAMSSRGVPFNVSMYRHYRTGIAKFFLTGKQSSSHGEVAFWQAGHSGVTAQRRYAGGEFSFEDLSLAKLDEFHAVSQRWHELLGLNKSDRISQCSNKVPKTPLNDAPSTLSRTTTPNENGEKEVEVVACVVPAGGIRNRVIAPSVFNRLSLANTEELGYHTVLRQKDAKRSRTNSAPNGNPKITSGFLNETVLGAVRKVLGQEENADVKFKSAAQRAAVFESTLHTVLTGYTSSMLVILPTGGGKTLCWSAPALREQQLWDSCSMKPPITTVIVPLIALQQDILRKCAKCNIRCADWKNRFEDGVTVVVCSIDVVFSNDYNRYVSALFAQGRLARTVVDEVHLLLQWKTFRRFGLIGPRLRPKSLREAPLLLMSATVTSEMISELQDLLAIDMCCFKVFRALNTRPNICYDVLYVECVRMEDMVDRCASIIRNDISNMKSRDRIIAYCLTVKECKLLHNALCRTNSRYNAFIYYGSMSHEEREANYDAWINSKSNVPLVMSATSAFSCGIDHEHVREVVHVGGSRTVVELAQESGRLGRDGASSRNVIVYNQQYLHNRMNMPESERVEDSPKYSFGDIKTVLKKHGHCRRQIIESFLNDSPRGTCDGSELRCDVCEKTEVTEVDGGKATSMETSRHTMRRLGESDIWERSAQTRVTVPIPSSSRLKSQYCQRYLIGFDKSTAIWKAKQISAAKCAVCLFSGVRKGPEEKHNRYMRGMCYRCVEAKAVH